MINQLAPNFEVDALLEHDIKKISLADYKGKWVILFFYPADFTFVCPTELKELTEYYEAFRELNTEVLSISTDTPHTHKAWKDASPTIANIHFPMLADTTGRICKLYHTYIQGDGYVEDEGRSYRATVLIDPDGRIKFYEIQANGIGRNAAELLRRLQAAQHIREHPGEVCPMSWKPGKETLKPGMDLVRKIMKLTLIILLLINLVATGIIAYQVHLMNTNNPAALGTCFGDGGCGIVAQSEWSAIFGIKLTTYGFFMFSLLIILLLAQYRIPELWKITFPLFIISATGSAFFIYLQDRVIGALCTYCMLLDISTIVGAHIYAVFLWQKKHGKIQVNKDQ